MIKLLVVFVLLLNFIKNEAGKKNKMFSINKKNFKKIVKKHKFTVIDYYGTQRDGFLDEFSKIKQKFLKNHKDEKDLDVFFGTVDCIDNFKLCQKSDVFNYPTFALYVDGKFNKLYQGKVDVNSLYLWIERRARRNIIFDYKDFDIDEEEEYEQTKVIGFFNTDVKDEDNENYKIFKELSEKLDEVKWYEITDPTDKDKTDFKIHTQDEKDYLIVYPFFSKSFVKLSFYVDVLVNARNVLWEAFPIIDDLSIPQTYSRIADIFSSDFVTILFFDEMKMETEKIEEIKKIVGLSALKQKKNICFSYVDVNKFSDMHKFLLSDFKLLPKYENFTLVMMNKYLGKERYVYNQEEFENYSIDKWVRDVLKKKIDPVVKSEEIPKQQISNVKKVVGKNFRKFVFDKTKDVMVYIYSEKCEKCKKDFKLLEDLATFYEDIVDLKIVKIDGEKNDIPDYNLIIEKYPTILFYGGNRKKGEPFPSTRKKDFKSLKLWIKDKAHVSADYIQRKFRNEYLDNEDL